LLPVLAVPVAQPADVDVEQRQLTAPGGVVVKEGDWLSIDGTTGD
jgi:pyruvate,orthophosphate dikinase